MRTYWQLYCLWLCCSCCLYRK